MAGSATGCNELGLLGLGNEPSEDDWMVHCRILEHAASGMMTLVHVREP